MSRDKKQKYLLYLVLMIVLFAAASFQHFVSNAKVDKCLDAGYEYDFQNKTCLGNPVN
jgi:formate/nitrite transporter FocA (FNT family)